MHKQDKKKKNQEADDHLFVLFFSIQRDKEPVTKRERSVLGEGGRVGVKLHHQHFGFEHCFIKAQLLLVSVVS